MFIHSLFLFACAYFSLASGEIEPQELVPGNSYTCCEQDRFAHHTETSLIYCFSGAKRDWINTWMTPTVKIDLKQEDYEIYEGKNPEEVYRKVQTLSKSYKSPFTELIYLHPFDRSCFAIRTDHNYSLVLKIDYVDLIKESLYVGGVILYHVAPYLADSTAFYYIVGSLSGTIASIALLVYFICRQLPLKSSAVIGTLAGGTSLIYFAYEKTTHYLMFYTSKYRDYFVWYVGLSSLLSFAVCYRFGPVTNKETMNLVKWFLRLSALTAIFFSSSLKVIPVLTITYIFIVHFAIWFVWLVKKWL